jgi:flagellar biosynthesis/type III secretory pathway protein FliH
MSSSDEGIDPRAAKSTQSTMKSLFASDSRTAAANSTSLKYEGKSKKDDVAGSGAAAQAVGGQLPSSGGGGGAAGGAAASGTVTAAQATVQAYRGESAAGAAVIATVIVNSVPMVLLIDRDRRPLARLRCNADLQLLQNQASPVYATLYDPAISQHWTLMFKSDTDCRNFIVATTTLLHYIQLADGPVEPFAEFAAPSDARSVARKGDKAIVSLTTWVLQRIGGFGSAFFTTGKIVEEIPSDAPRSLVLGQGTMMSGVEDALIGMGVGGKRIAFLSPKKTKVLSGGLSNPEIGPSESVVVLMTLHSVGRASGGGLSGGIGSDSGDDSDDVRDKRKKGGGKKAAAGRSDDDEDDLFTKKSSSSGNGSKRKSMNSRALTTAVEEQQQQQHQRQQHVPQIAASPVAAVPVAAAPSLLGPGGIDQNTLLQTMLLQTLHMQSQQQQQQQRAPEPAIAASASAFDVDRGLDRIYQQLFSLSEKLDRLDVEGKLAKNNESLERIVKKAVGKMPVNDVDVEDMAKDRDQLLAKIEHLKKRVEEATDNYHKALETMGTHKDQVSALKNDLAIERETSSSRIKELTERKRLELVDAEVKHRRELDKARELAHQQGLDEGFQKGYATGKLEALQLTGTTTADEFKVKAQELQAQIVDAESRIQVQASKNYQERRELLEQIDSLNSLIKRLESRETTKAVGLVDTSSAMCKTLRRAMNSTYASVESQFYAAERDTISVEDALAMVLVSIKSETRTFVEEIKREGALIVSAAANSQTHRSANHDENGGEVGGESGATGSSSGDARSEAISAYKTGGTYQDPSSSLPPPSSSDAMDEYYAMRAEIEQYQTQRLVEAREEELTSDGGRGGHAAPPPPPMTMMMNPTAPQGSSTFSSEFDVHSLPLPPLDDGDDDALPPPPPTIHHHHVIEEEEREEYVPPARESVDDESGDNDSFVRTPYPGDHPHDEDA